MNTFLNYPLISANYFFCIPFHVSELWRQRSVLCTSISPDGYSIQLHDNVGETLNGLLGERRIKMRSFHFPGVLVKFHFPINFSVSPSDAQKSPSFLFIFYL